MAITVELTYEMSKIAGNHRLEVAQAATVRELVEKVREQLGDRGDQLEKLTRGAAIAVNGVLANHKRGMRTQLSDGDRVSFVKAAAGG